MDTPGLPHRMILERRSRRDQARWFSAQYSSIAFHERPAERTHAASFQSDLFERKIEIAFGHRARQHVIRRKGTNVLRVGRLFTVRLRSREEPARVEATRVRCESHGHYS